MQSSGRTASKLTLFRRQPTDGRPSLVALTRGIKSCDICLSFIGYFTLDICLAMDPGIREAHGFSRRYRTGPASCLLHHFPEVKVAPTPKRASLHRTGKRHDEHRGRNSADPPSHTPDEGRSCSELAKDQGTSHPCPQAHIRISSKT